MTTPSSLRTSVAQWLIDNLTLSFDSRPSLLARSWQDGRFRAIVWVCALVACGSWFDAGMPMICHSR